MSLITPRPEKKILAINTSALQQGRAFGGVITPPQLPNCKNTGLLTPSTDSGQSILFKKTRKSSPLRSVKKDDREPGFIIQIGWGDQVNTIREVNYQRMPHLSRNPKKRSNSISETPEKKRRTKERTRRSISAA